MVGYMVNGQITNHLSPDTKRGPIMFKKFALVIGILALFPNMVLSLPPSLAARVKTVDGQQPFQQVLGLPNVKGESSYFIRKVGFDYTTPENLTQSPPYSDYFPSPYLMNNGELWLVWNEWDSKNLLRIVSHDSGFTWSSEVDTIYTVSSDIYGVYGLDIVQVNSGDIFIFYSEQFWSDGWHGDAYYLVSGDYGGFWSSPQALTTDGERNLYPCATVTSNGWIWVFYSSVRGGSSYDIWYTYSDDNGDSWQPPTRVTYTEEPSYLASLVEAESSWVFYQSYIEDNSDIYYNWTLAIFPD